MNTHRIKLGKLNERLHPVARDYMSVQQFRMKCHTEILGHVARCK